MSQEPQPGAQLVFNPARRLFNLPGDFRFSKTFKDRQFQQLALRFGQTMNQFFQQSAPLFNLSDVGMPGHPEIQLQKRLKPGMCCGSKPTPAALPVNGPCPGIKRQPNDDATAARLDPLCITPQTKEDFLENILSRVTVRNNFSDQSIEVGRSQIVELGQHRLVSLCDARQELIGC